jgi:DNA (cytosine-5)-methyltransferase 1
VAWEPLGWKAAWYSQFDPEHSYKRGPDFASAVLAHHYPDVPNLGDIRKIHDKETFRKEEIDLLVGGTPCQSFSLSGFRKGLRDKRGRLALTFCEIARDKRPRWVVWENVADVLSSGGGRDFGSILGALADCGYGLAYRVLDAQFFGVPQRRRRVFVVGHLGDTGANRAEEVLFEREGGFWDAAEGGALVRGEPSLAVEVAGGPAVYLHIEPSTERSLCLLASGTGRNINAETFVIHNLPERGEFDASLVDVRKLTPLEWERLQGFPDGHTLVPWRGKPAELCPDTPRYSALGNSVATPVLRWIGERIAMVDALPDEHFAEQCHPERFAKTLTDSELVERCVQGFRTLREIAPFLREARDRFAQPGRRVPVLGNPTWTEWVAAPP